MFVWFISCLLCSVVNSDVLELAGAGSSLAYNAFSAVALAYSFVEPSVSIEYTSLTSERGICRIKSATRYCNRGDNDSPLALDFAAAETALDDADYIEYPDLQMYPVIASAVVPVFNIGGPKSLVLSTSVLARIFRGNITVWDDPAIRSLNPGFAMWRVPPAQRIEVVVFGVAIGVTQILKQSLAHFDAAFGPQLGEGAEPMWPNVSVTFQNDSRRMLAYVLATPYTIGYVALDDAVLGQAPRLRLLKSSGAIVLPTQAAVEYAVLELGSDFGNNGDDPAHLTADIHNAQGAHSWPIVGYTYLVMRTQTMRRGATCENVRAVVHFWNWFWTADVVPRLLAQHFVGSLPAVVRNAVLARFRGDIQCNDSPVWESVNEAPIFGVGPTLVTGLFNTLLNVYAIVKPDNMMTFTVDEATWRLDINQQLKGATFVATTDPPAPAVAAGATLIFAGVGIVPITLLTVVLDGPTLAAILEGTITDWLAPEILALNPSGVLGPSGRPLNESTPQPITLLHGPTATSHSLTVLMRAFSPAYTGRALLDAMDFPTEDVLRTVIFDFPLALAVTAFTGLLPPGIRPVPLYHNGQVVAPSWQALAACGSPDALSASTCTVSLHRSAQPGCYPLARTIYLSLKRPDCSDDTSARTATSALMDWVFGSPALDAVLHTARMAPLARLTPAVQACNTRALGVVSCVPAPTDFLPIIIGASAGGGVLLLFTLGFIVILRRHGLRDTSFAPKDSKPFCIVFTDIESSTHLWATIPTEMAAALEVHHSTTRAILRQCGLYEVKTLGDSFMCATKDPWAAAAFGLELQRRLFAAPWGTDAIDFAYAEKDRLAQEEPGINLSSRVHFVLRGELSDCWRGLRVRVGIHYGPGEVRFDSVARGYDYYGTVVNTAARICSVGHGGQLLISDAVHLALRRAVPDSVWTDLGRHPLAGLPDAVQLWQGLPEGPLARRTFPPLRLEKAKFVGEEAGDVEAASNPGGARSSTSTAAFHPESHPLVQNGTTTAEDLQQVYSTAMVTVRLLLATQTSKFQSTMLKGLCQRLKVPYRGSSAFSLQLALHGLVLRVLPAVVAGGGRRGTATSVGECGASQCTPQPVASAPLRQRSPVRRAASPAPNRPAPPELFAGLRRSVQLLHAFSAGTIEELAGDERSSPTQLPNVPLWTPEKGHRDA